MLDDNDNNNENDNALGWNLVMDRLLCAAIYQPQACAEEARAVHSNEDSSWLLALAAGDHGPLHNHTSVPSTPLHWTALAWQRGQHPYGQAVLQGAAAACRGEWSIVGKLLLQLPWLRPVLLVVAWDMAAAVASDAEAAFVLRRAAMQHLGQHWPPACTGGMLKALCII